MSLITTSVKVTGTPDSSGWSQVHEFYPEDSEKQKLRGKFFAVMSTSNPESDINAIQTGREILSRLHEEYYGNTESAPYEALKSAVEKVSKEFASFEVEIAAGSYVENVLYTAVNDNCQAVLLRKGAMAKILIGNNEVIAASGYPNAQDVFLIGTKSFFDMFAEGVIKANLESNDSERTAELFASVIHSNKNTGRVCASITSFFEGADTEEIHEVKQENEQVQISENPEIRRNGARSFFDNLLKRIPKRQIYIKKVESEEEGSRKKTFFSVGVILVALLIVSIVFGYKQKKNNDFKASYEDKLINATHDFEESQNLLGIDDDKARELFVSSQLLVDEIEKMGIKDRDVEDLKRKLDEKKGEILKEYSVEPVLYLDLSLTSSDYLPEQMLASSENILTFDSNTNKSILVSFESKKTEVAAGKDDAEGATMLFNYANRIFALKDDGVYEIESGGSEKVIEKEWGDNSIAQAYAGNVYIIDKTDSKILRYSGAEGEFGSKKDWLAPGIEADLSNVVSVAIDGSIWIATSTGKILKFTQGSPINIDIKDTPINKISYIYTNEECEYVYVLDKESKQMIVIDKSGKYKGVYKSGGFSKADGLGINEEQKIGIILSEGKLMSFVLSHTN